MDPVWSAMTAPPGIFLGGIIGSTATDGDRIYGPDTIAGEQWAIDENGGYSWISSDGGPLHFSATSTANGVVYNTDMTGHLNARDAATGLLLAKIPLGSPSWAGVAIAGGSVFTATGTQGGSGYLVAYRPRTSLGNGGNANEGDEPRSESVKRGECAPSETRDEGQEPQGRARSAPRRRAAQAAGGEAAAPRAPGAAHGRPAAPQRADLRPPGRRQEHAPKQPKQARTRRRRRARGKVERRKRTDRVERKPCTRPPDEIPEPYEEDPHAHSDHAHSRPRQGGGATKGALRRGDRYVPKPAGHDVARTRGTSGRTRSRRATT